MDSATVFVSSQKKIGWGLNGERQLSDLQPLRFVVQLPQPLATCQVDQLELPTHTCTIASHNLFSETLIALKFFMDD
jgi:hypothetical protein